MSDTPRPAPPPRRTVPHLTCSAPALPLLLLCPCSLKDWKQLELFEREAQILASLAHRGIPQYLEYFEDDSEADRAFFLVQVSARTSSSQRRQRRTGGVGCGLGGSVVAALMVVVVCNWR